MLYNMEWLRTGESFPPASEKDRIDRYRQNAALFDGDHFALSSFRHQHGYDHIPYLEVYNMCARRISQVVGNFEEVISFPTLLNYQRLMSLKMADLVCGEPPTITGRDQVMSQEIVRVRDYTSFDEKLFSAVIDISRYGDAIQRVYLDNDGVRTFTNWDPTEWYPVVSQDGTNTITHHVLCWRENRGKSDYAPDWYLHVQIHPTAKAEVGMYEYRVFKMDSYGGSIGRQVSSSKVPTGLTVCAVQHLKSYSTSNTVYGYDDYLQLDSILAEIMTRVGQISAILDKHADPNITGPASMLSVDERTGEYKLRVGKFYAVSPGEEQPKYMVWEGQLNAAFNELEVLLNQMYILSELGSALLGSTDGSGSAISGTALRFKMANPLAKARRISNSLTRSVRVLFDALSDDLAFEDISVFWSDGLPNDPRENVEIVKMATGEAQMMPLETAIVEYFGRTSAEAAEWIRRIHEEQAAKTAAGINIDEDVNKPGPQDGTGINPQKRGSETGLNSFNGLNNKNITKVE